ncbi:MAG: glycosyltransferase [Anaerolineae bacterium]|nr:glycosyltransferase [Anaerolineae bacterium]
MKLAVLSHKPCWQSENGGFVTHGGFPFQMQALSELFDATTLVLPQIYRKSAESDLPLQGHNLTVQPLTELRGKGLKRKLLFPFWLLRNVVTILRESRKADAIHAPIPGDIGTVGIFAALLLRKPLFVRHCGNWHEPRTPIERFWKWLMQMIAGGRNVMMATGGDVQPPSNNPKLSWIFATSLPQSKLTALHRVRSAPQDAPQLITVSRQEWDKGTDIVIRALPELLQQRPNAVLHVVGDGSALDAFKSLSDDLQVRDAICFHGQIAHEQVLRLLQQADLFCYPTSASEGFPKVVLEALASGLPVITTKVSVLPFLIGTKGGVVLETISTTELVRAANSVLSDAGHYGELSRGATEIAGGYSLERWRDVIATRLQAEWQQPITESPE